MSNAIVKHDPRSLLAQYDDATKEMIRRTVAPGTNDDEFMMYLYAAKEYGLDPILRQIIINIYYVKDDKGNTVRQPSIQIPRDGFLALAQKNPDFMGMKSGVVCEGDDFEMDYEGETVRHKFGTKRGRVLGAWAIAYHRTKKPVIEWAPMNEYDKSNAAKGGFIWKSNPTAMIRKVPEAIALKKLLGLTNVHSIEEMPDTSTPADAPTCSDSRHDPEHPVIITQAQANETKRIFGRHLCALCAVQAKSRQEIAGPKSQPASLPAKAEGEIVDAEFVEPKPIPELDSNTRKKIWKKMLVLSNEDKEQAAVDLAATLNALEMPEDTKHLTPFQAEVLEKHLDRLLKAKENRPSEPWEEEVAKMATGELPLDNRLD